MYEQVKYGEGADFGECETLEACGEARNVWRLDGDTATVVRASGAPLTVGPGMTRPAKPIGEVAFVAEQALRDRMLEAYPWYPAAPVFMWFK